MNWNSILAATVKRKAFISFHQADRIAVDQFITDFEDIFIPKVLGANDNDDFINSSNTDYVMSKIREKYLGDSSVTIVMIGSCTHSRRYVDWEIKSSLRQGSGITPNGLIGILLKEQGSQAFFPERLRDNWNTSNTNTYSRIYTYPQNSEQFRSWIEDAYVARTTRDKFIKNSSDMMRYNAQCLVHGITH